LEWVEQFLHYVSFIDQSVEVTTRLVVADRLTAPFELSEQRHLGGDLGHTLKPPARLNPIEIAVDVELQQDRGMI
jgi:hypothetical protein